MDRTQDVCVNRKLWTYETNDRLNCCTFSFKYLILFDRCQEALSDLHELRTIAPHESMVYYLLGKVYKKLGKEHLALMNLSRATDMDPRGVYTQIKESLDPVRESGAGGRTDQSEGGGSISPGQTSTPISGSGGQIGGGHVEGPGHHSAATPQGHTHSRHPHSPGE